jgi:hypothetical protein
MTLVFFMGRRSNHSWAASDSGSVTIGSSSHSTNSSLVSVPETIQTELNGLLTKADTFFQLTALKKRAKDFGLKQIRQEVEKHKLIKTHINTGS